MRKWVTDASTYYKQELVNKVVLHTILCFNIIQHYYEQLHSKNIFKLAKPISPKKVNARIKSAFAALASSLSLLILFFSCMIVIIFWSPPELSLIQ